MGHVDFLISQNTSVKFIFDVLARTNEIQALGQSLEKDTTFLKPNWEDFHRLSVLPVWSANCLLFGINPDHRASKFDDFSEIISHADGQASIAGKSAIKFFEALRHQLDISVIPCSGKSQIVALEKVIQWALDNRLNVPTELLQYIKVEDHQSVEQVNTVRLDEPKPKSKTWKNLAGDYILKTKKNGLFGSTNELFAELQRTAGEEDSPFKGYGEKRKEKTLYLKEGGTLALKTLQNDLTDLEASFSV